MADEAARAVPDNAYSTSVLPRRRKVRGEVDIRLVVGDAELVQDETRPVVVEAAEHPVCGFDGFERWRSDQSDLQRPDSDIGIDFADQTFGQVHFRAAGYRIVGTCAYEAVAVGVIQFVVVDKGDRTDADQRKLLED